MKTKKILFILSLVFCSLGSLLCRGIEASAQGSLKSKGIINVSEGVKFDKTDLELLEGNNKSNNTDINNLKSNFNNLTLEVSKGKSLIAKALTDQGEIADAKASFQELADKVNVMAGTQYQAGLADGVVNGKQNAVDLLFPKLNSINELINTQLATDLSTSYSASSTLSEVASGIESSKIKLNESLNQKLQDKYNDGIVAGRAGYYTPAQLDAAKTSSYNSGITAGQNNVKGNPNSYGLYTQAQYEAGYNSGITAGKAETKTGTMKVMLYQNKGVGNLRVRVYFNNNCIYDTGGFRQNEANVAEYSLGDKTVSIN